MPMRCSDKYDLDLVSFFYSCASWPLAFDRIGTIYFRKPNLTCFRLCDINGVPNAYIEANPPSPYYTRPRLESSWCPPSPPIMVLAAAGHVHPKLIFHFT